MTAGLRRFREPPAGPPEGERCELCGEPVGEPHGHVVNLARRNILCACRACHLLFTREGAAGGRYRAVPERYLHDPSFQLTPRQWDALQIPVAMAFFFYNSSIGGTLALYPSPAGATESEPAADAWEEVAAANPELAELDPDVEALLVRRRRDRFECYLVPIDACYELVGLVRLHWRGFDGGADAWREIDAWFERLRGRCHLVERGEAS